MFDLTLPTLLTRIAVLVPILAIYGFALTGAARLLGDQGPAQDGRLTLNPAAHLDLIGAVAFLVSGLGWMTPLHLTPTRLRPPVLGPVAAVLAPSLAMLALAWLAQRLIPLAINMDSLAWGAIVTSGLQTLSGSAVLFALINLVPVPPLAAGALLGRTSEIAGWLERRRLLVSLALLVVFATGKIQLWLAPIVAAVLALID
ncbi:hypothetical protein [Devosia sp. 1566]|uniref:hypothetical protein n=1 Tax=Devosia sp. 1566 TaxID=2499144 RepID=UPI0020BE302F|nr:hypothetical protein [Devosia sp. 1566]